MRSIERYLLAWVMGALCLGAVVIILVTYLVTLDEMNEIFDADLKNVAEALGTHHRAGIDPGDPGLPRLPVRTDVADPAEIVTITWTQDGRRVFSSDPRVAIPFMSVEALSQLRVHEEEWIVYTDVSANGVAQAASVHGSAYVIDGGSLPTLHRAGEACRTPVFISLRGRRGSAGHLGRRPRGGGKCDGRRALLRGAGPARSRARAPHHQL